MAKSLTHAWVRDHLPARAADAHKGAFGHLVVLAGSTGFTGAARLCCEGALRSGVGLVTLGIPASLVPLVVPDLLETMWRPMPETDQGAFAAHAAGVALGLAEGKDAIVVGPGIGTGEETGMFVNALLESWTGPLVLDADALNLLSRDTTPLKSRVAPTVLTPHPGEMARLLRTTTAEVQHNREEAAATFAKEQGATLVLKGSRTIVASPDGRVCECPLGNHGMATGGTGDVLTGLVGGLLAQGVAQHEAAAIAVYVHALAGDIAAEQTSPRALLARDLVGALGEAWQRIEAS